MEADKENPLSDPAFRPSKLVDNIDKILQSLKSSNKKDREEFFNTFYYLNEMPDFMKKLGITGNYFSIKYGVISKHYKKDANHRLTEQNWKDLCVAITDPFAIATYQGGGYRLFTSVRVN